MSIWLIILIILTVIGTFTGSVGGFIPFYTKKAGKSFGINLGIFGTEFEEGAVHYGINFSGWLNRNWNGKVVGINISPFNLSSREGGIKKEVIGLEIGLWNESICKGIQIGVLCSSCRYNDEDRDSFLINFDFRD